MSEETTQQFLARLWELQEQAGIKNSALARLLGCSPSYIRHMKAGRKGNRIGLHIALAAARHFPELRILLLAELPEVTDNVALEHKDEEV